MSWQAYVDDHLMCEIEGNYLSSAAIIGHDGSVWAQSASFPEVKPEEFRSIMNHFKDPTSCAPLFLGGTQYLVLQVQREFGVVRGKKGPGGVTVKKTNLALLIGIYNEPTTPEQCNITVERLGDYLIDQGL